MRSLMVRFIFLIMVFCISINSYSNQSKDNPNNSEELQKLKNFSTWQTQTPWNINSTASAFKVFKKTGSLNTVQALNGQFGSLPNDVSNITYQGKTPIVAFGEKAGVSPLYCDMTYRFQVDAGPQTLTTTNHTQQKNLKIVVYDDKGQLVHEETILIPLNRFKTGDEQVKNAFVEQWDNNYLMKHFGMIPVGSELLQQVYGLESFMQYAGINSRIIFSHTSKNSKYTYLVQLMREQDQEFQLLYSLGFSDVPPVSASIVQQLFFMYEPGPANYFETTQTFTATITSADNKPINIEQYRKTVTNTFGSYEQLDTFVNERKDALALISYVQNEIELVDGHGLQDDTVAPAVICASKINRSPLTTFLEGQGSPWEQCDLLVYLLRQAGFIAAYAESKEPLLFFRHDWSALLRMQLGAKNNYDTVEVNYPWVVYYDEKAQTWVHVFPWIKDTKVSEGMDVYGILPKEYNSAGAWVRQYLENDPNIFKYVKNNNDTAAVLFKSFVDAAASAKGIDPDTVGVRYSNRKQCFSSFADLPKPVSFVGEAKLSTSIFNRNELYTTTQIEIASMYHPNKQITTAPMRTADMHNRALYLYFEPISNNPEETQHKMILRMEGLNGFTQSASGSFDGNNINYNQEKSTLLDSTDGSIQINISYNSNITGPIPSRPIKRLYFIEKGVLTGICMNLGRVTKQMLEAHAERFTQDKAVNLANDAQGRLAYLVGMSYFEKMSIGEKILKELHKIDNAQTYKVGLSKLSPNLEKTSPNLNANGELRGYPVLQFPQVDMYFAYNHYYNGSIRPDMQEDIFSARNNYRILSITDGSANEHQVINDLYQDKYAISTVKLLQLSHKRHVAAGNTGTGFLTFTRATLEEANRDPVAVAKRYFGHIPNLDLPKILQENRNQWDIVGDNLLNGDDSSYAMAYMTPGYVYSDDWDSKDSSKQPTYRGTGALIFTNQASSALISDNANFIINGGYGSKLPANFFSKTNISQLDLKWDTDKFEIRSGDLFAQNTIDKGILKVEAHADYQSPFTKLGDPVDIVTGAFQIQAEDIVISGPLPLVLKRNYSSANPFTSEFGYGWKCSLVPYLTLSPKDAAANQAEGALIYAAESDGTVIAYRQKSANTWEAKQDDNTHIASSDENNVVNNIFRSRITKETKNNVDYYYLHGADGSLRIYRLRSFPVADMARTRPYLEQWTDAQGNSISFAYEERKEFGGYGQVKRMILDNGDFIGFKYNTSGQVTEAYTKYDKKVEYAYDEFDDLVSVKLADGAVINYKYEHHFLDKDNKKITYSAHRLIREEKPNGRVLQNTYDQQGRVLSQSVALNQGKLSLNATFTYSKDATMADPIALRVVTDGLGHITTYKLYHTLITQITDPLGFITYQSWYLSNKQYFDAKQQTIITVPVGLTGPPNSLMRKTDKRGLTTVYIYNKQGDLAQKQIQGTDLSGDGKLQQLITNYTYTDLGQLQTIAHDAQATRFYYQDHEHPRLVTRIEKRLGVDVISLQDYTYTSKGLLASKTLSDPSNSQKLQALYDYDKYGFPSTSTLKNGNNTDIVTKFEYDTQHNLAREIYAGGAYTRYIRDTMNRLTGVIKYDAANKEVAATHYHYNDNGELVWIKGPAHAKDYTLFDYDASGNNIFTARWRLTHKSHEKIVPEVIAPEQGIDIADPSRQRPKSKKPEPKKTNKANKQTTTALDEKFKTTKEEPENINAKAKQENVINPHIEYRTGITTLTPMPGYQSFKSQAIALNQYDVLSRLTHNFDPEGHVTEYTYDAIGQVITKTVSEQLGGKVLSKESYEYESGGFVAKIIHADNSVTSFTYTTNGLLKKVAFPNGTNRLLVYDSLGRITEETTTHGAKWIINYDDCQRTITKQEKSTGIAEISKLDLQGNIIKVIDATGNSTHYSYDQLGRITSKKLGSEETKYLRAYDRDGNTNLETLYSDGTSIFSTTNVIGKLLKTASTTPIGKHTQSEYINYQYEAGDLVQHIIGGSYETIATKINNQDGKVLANGVFFTDFMYPVWHDYTYDRNYNQLSYHDSDSADSYEYNSLGQITKKTSSQNAATTFDYDSMGRLIHSSLPMNIAWDADYVSPTQTTTTTRWDTQTIQGQTTKELSANQATITDLNGYTFTYDQDVLGRIIQETIDHANGYHEVIIYTYDQLSRVTKIKRHNKNYTTVIERQYDPAGNILNETVMLDKVVLANWQQNWLAGKRIALGFNQQPLWQFKTTATGKLYNMQFMGLSWNYTYNTAGLLTQRQAPMFALKLQYDRGGHIIKQNLGVYFSQELLWQGDGKLAASTLNAHNATEIYKYTYQHKRLVHDRVAAYAFDWDTNQDLGILTKVVSPEHEHIVYKPTTDYFRPAAELIDTKELKTTYDNMGRVVERGFPNKKQILTWDPHGHLTEVELISNKHRIYLWQASYDGLGRRVQTKFTTEDRKTTTTTSLYDPEVEFLELGLVIKAADKKPMTVWKVYGPSNNGIYGENNGHGGLEMVAEADTKNGYLVIDGYLTINSLQGDIILAGVNGNYQSKKLFSPYGPIQVETKTNFDKPGELAQIIINSMSWHNKILDPTGFINFGARYYDPLTKRFLSCDPLGHMSTPDLYSYASGDPINNIDPDGRFASKVYETTRETVNWVNDNPDEALLGAGFAVDVLGTFIPHPAIKSVGKGLTTAGEVLRIVKQTNTNRAFTVERELAKSGEDLFVGTFNEVKRANDRSGLADTHTAHHVVQNAVSSVKRGEGIAISMRDELHEQTRTFRRRVDPAPDLRTHLARDINDVRKILKDDGYDQSTINRQLNELIKQNKKLGGFGK